MGLSVLLLQIYPLGLSLCYSLAGLLSPLIPSTGRYPEFFLSGLSLAVTIAGKASLVLLKAFPLSFHKTLPPPLIGTTFHDVVATSIFVVAWRMSVSLFP